jgi:hypothetical protein
MDHTCAYNTTTRGYRKVELRLCADDENVVMSVRIHSATIERLNDKSIVRTFFQWQHRAFSDCSNCIAQSKN